MPHVLDGTPYEQELTLEREARSRGVARYRRLAQEAIDRGDGAHLKTAERLMVHWFVPLRRLIAAHKRKLVAARAVRGDPTLYAPFFLRFNSAKMAVATMSEVLGSLMSDPMGVRPMRLWLAIGREINAEANIKELRRLRYAQWKAHKDGKNPDRFSYAPWESLIKTTRQKKKFKPRKVNWVSNQFFPGARWSLRIQARLGACLMELLLKVATCADHDKPFVPCFKVRQMGLNREIRYFLTPAADQLLEDGHRRRSHLLPVYLPMVVPPMPWTAKEMGGYVQLPTLLVKKSQYKKHPMDNETIREAVNCLNSTPWRVNRWILDIMREVAASGGNVAGVPRQTLIERPEAPPNVEDDPILLKAWKKRWVLWRRANLALKSRMTVFNTTLDTAGKMTRYPRFYLPHQLDFTGRAYPMPSTLHHQSDDINRGLLEFADARPVDSDLAQFWLKVQLANRCGVDKVSFDERIAWVDHSMEAVRGWVADPLENTGWMEMDDPWQALAAARALLDDQAAQHLPIQVDATNNALQHYAAMLRDEDTGRLVNLVPADKPADFYSLVTERVKHTVGLEADAGNEWAKRLDGWVNRKIVKQTAMTTYYRVTMTGARQQVMDKMAEAGFDEHHLWHASRYLAKKILEATSQCCPTVHEAMLWLETCARMIVKTTKDRKGQLIAWTTPLGMEVEQAYRQSSRVCIWTDFHNLQFAEVTEDCPVDALEQVNGFAPNYVHSLDAAHIQCVAVCARDAKIAFAGVHDCLWTHAADMDRLREMAAEQFTLIHEQPVLESLRTELKARYALRFPPAPPLGSLDLSQVARSDYLLS
jgi:DNA-directed RNA polymerase